MTYIFMAVFADYGFRLRRYYFHEADIPYKIWHYSAEGYPYRKRPLFLVAISHLTREECTRMEEVALAPEKNAGAGRARNAFF